jgi:Ca-activated chloride channel family protein
MADAIANRKAVEAAKKRKPPPGSQSGNKPDDKKDKGRSGESGGQQPSQDGTSPGNGKPNAADQGARQPHAPAQPGSPENGDTQPGKPADTEAQRAADAAQRARMQQALRDGDRGKNAESTQAQQPPGKRDETPAQRERRLANEAWLRRVPDDPGGLLRARFRLEYERRQQGSD